MSVRARATVPSLKILAVTVRFARNQEAKMLPTLLKCFPRLEALHVLVMVEVKLRLQQLIIVTHHFRIY